MATYTCEYAKRADKIESQNWEANYPSFEGARTFWISLVKVLHEEIVGPLGVEDAIEYLRSVYYRDEFQRWAREGKLWVSEYHQACDDEDLICEEAWDSVKWSLLALRSS